VYARIAATAAENKRLLARDKSYIIMIYENTSGCSRGTQVYVHMKVYTHIHKGSCGCRYGVATISRLLKIVGVFCRI